MSAATTDAAVLVEHDKLVERLLAEAEAACGPVAWPKVEALITSLVELYGEGLGRMMAHARGAAANAAELDEQLAADEVVSSLLLLHDLHPVALDRRVERALERLHEELPHAGSLAMVGVADGVVKLRAVDAKATLPTSVVVARAIEREAPELEGVQVDGATPARADGLLPAASLLRGGRS
ncbi:MAG: hypothetical protein JWO86_5192 [Myxococcaceae bacterium]|nr:hypothetical protein [Myxococcaceae bacterium]